MNHVSLDALAREHLKRAAQSGNGRSAETVFGGHEKVLRQTVIALIAGAELAEHENPGEATLTVIVGRIELAGQDASWTGRAGDLLVIPDQRHSLRALEDSAVLLTVAKR